MLGCYNQLVSKCLVILIFSDEPEVIPISDDPYTLKCSLDSQDADVWIEFASNDNVLGYCGQFTSPVKHKQGISINYNSSMEACILTIDKLTKDNEGNYSCSVMVPYPDGNGFLKINSTSVALHAFDTTKTIGYTVGVAVVATLIIIVGVIIISCVCKRKKWYKKLRWCCNCGPERDRLNDQ